MKQTVVALFFATFAFLASAQPSFAADQTRKPNFFDQLRARVAQTTQRIYLQLPGDKPGQMVLNQAAIASTTLRSATMSMDVSTNMQKDDESLANLRVHIDGPIQFPSDNAVGASEKLQQDLRLTAAVSVQGSTMEADADLKMTDERVFFKLNTVPVLPFFHLTELKGRWLFLHTADVAKKTPDAEKPLTAEQKQQVAEANAQLIKKSEVSAAQKAMKNDRPVYVVSTVIPKEALAEYLTTMQSIHTGDDSLSRSNLDTMLSYIGEVRATFWIDRSNFYVRHLEVPLTVRRPDGGRLFPTQSTASAGSTLGGIEQTNTVQAEGIFEFDKFNAPVEFSEPANAEDAQTVLQGMMSNILPSATSSESSSMMMAPTELPQLSTQQRMMLDQLKATEQ